MLLFKHMCAGLQVFTVADCIIILCLCCSTHMQDLQEVTQETHYENYRAEKLANGGMAPAKTSRRWVVSLTVACLRGEGDEQYLPVLEVVWCVLPGK